MRPGSRVQFGRDPFQGHRRFLPPALGDSHFDGVLLAFNGQLLRRPASGSQPARDQTPCTHQVRLQLFLPAVMFPRETLEKLGWGPLRLILALARLAVKLAASWPRS